MSLSDTRDLSLQVRSLTLSASATLCVAFELVASRNAWIDTPFPESSEPHITNTNQHQPTLVGSQKQVFSSQAFSYTRMKRQELLFS